LYRVVCAQLRSGFDLQNPEDNQPLGDVLDPAGGKSVPGLSWGSSGGAVQTLQITLTSNTNPRHQLRGQKLNVAAQELQRSKDLGWLSCRVRHRYSSQ